MKKNLSIIIFFILIQGCSSDIPQEIIQPDKMEKVLFDIHIVDGYMSTLTKYDSTKIIASSYYNGIYKKFEIDSALYNKSMNYYYRHPVILNKIYAGVEKAFTEEQEKNDKKIALEIGAGTVTLPSLIILANTPAKIQGPRIEANPFDITLTVSRL